MNDDSPGGFRRFVVVGDGRSVCYPAHTRMVKELTSRAYRASLGRRVAGSSRGCCDEARSSRREDVVAI